MLPHGLASNFHKPVQTGQAPVLKVSVGRGNADSPGLGAEHRLSEHAEVLDLRSEQNKKQKQNKTKSQSTCPLYVFCLFVFLLLLLF